MIHLKLTEWDIKADFRGDAKDVDLKIQELLEPDRERGKIGVKYQIPRYLKLFENKESFDLC